MADGLETVRCGRCDELCKRDPDHRGDVQCPYCGTYLVICGGTTNALRTVDGDA